MPPSKRQRTSDDDPLARAIAPPPSESFAEREQRLVEEQEAKRISDAIDDEINRQRSAEKKGPKAIKILLLGALAVFHSIHITNHAHALPSTGQSESGEHIFCSLSAISSPGSLQENRQRSRVSASSIYGDLNLPSFGYITDFQLMHSPKVRLPADSPPGIRY